jgi:hypothetical protein
MSAVEKKLVSELMSITIFPKSLVTERTFTVYIGYKETPGCPYTLDRRTDYNQTPIPPRT